MTEREKEREKLKELLRNQNCHSPLLCDPNCKYAHLERCYEDRTADGLLANGVVVPPCKVGDTVYVITSDSPSGIEETRVSQIKIKVKENGKISYRISAPCVYDTWRESHWTFCEFDFGKTVFLTKEEALKALKERSEGK